MLHDALQTEGIVKFRVELVWKEGDENATSSIFLTSDGRVILQGRAISDEARRALALPTKGDMISVDPTPIHPIKNILQPIRPQPIRSHLKLPPPPLLLS